MYYSGKASPISSALDTLDDYIDTVYIRSIINSVPLDVEQDIASLKKQYLDQQIKALEYALQYKDEWIADPIKIWKLIYIHSTEWCKEFKMPIRVDHQVEV
jgi:hypothetical protein